jgi:hypothetical protein
LKAKITRVALGDIETDEDLFQWRQSGWQSTVEGREQIRALMGHLRNTGEPLDPLVVYPKDGRYVVIDGHHRLQAYEEVRWTKRVPVRVFQGSLQEARDAAFMANDKGRRPYSSQERLERAWDVTKRWHFDGAKELSKEVTVKMSGVSPRQVAYMRALLKERGEELRKLSWVEALRGAREYEPDPEWRSKKAQEVREALLGVKGVNYRKSPEILAEALEDISPEVPRLLVEQWPDIALDVGQQHELVLEQEQADVDAGLIERLDI